MRTWMGFVVVSSVGLFACGGYREDLGEISQGVGGIGSGGTGPYCGTSGGFSTLRTSFRNGVQVGGNGPYAGTADTFLYEDHPTSNYGSSETCTADGGSDRRNCLLRWSSLEVSPSATVSGASISLELADGTANIVNVFKMTRSWSEGHATWVDANLAAQWAGPGATGATDAGSTVLGTLTGPAGFQSFCLNPAGVAAVQDWVSNPANNRGVILGTGSSDGVHIRSSEFPIVEQRPTLTVFYTLP